MIGGVAGGITALGVAALNFLANQVAGLPQVSFVFFDWLSRVLPGNILTFFIDTMVSAITRFNLGPTATTAKQIEQGFAILLFSFTGVLFGLLLVFSERVQPARLDWYGTGIGAALALGILLILTTLGFSTVGPALSIFWILVVLMGWGWLLGKTIHYAAAPAGAPVDSARRQFLWIVGAGTFTVLVSAAGVSLGSQQKTIPQTGGPTPAPAKPLVDAATTSGPAQSPPEAVLQSRFPAVPGTRPELTSNAKFYRIDINTFPPKVDASSWRLELGGLVEHPLNLSLADLRSRPKVSQAITMECISNPVGGDLISTTLYTGLRLKDLLREAGLNSAAQAVYVEAVDGYYESVPLADVMDERTLLVYEMNQQTLPVEHGYPLRLYIPNRFGMKQPKWITKMTVVDHTESGYWVDRGWDAQAIPPVTSVIDVVDVENRGKAGIIPVGGIAYAGARGIQKVEVQIDQGPWEVAELRDPPLSPLTWVQWRYQWQAQSGQHVFGVRATDGEGNLQIEQPEPPEPAGATGIYKVAKSIPKQS